MDIDDLTIGQARQLAALFGSGPSSSSEAHPYHVGDNVFIRTVTHHYTGRLVRVYSGELVLVDAAWIADDGRFSLAFISGEFAEVEPYPDGLEVIITRGCILDCTSWPHALPRVQK